MLGVFVDALRLCMCPIRVHLYRMHDLPIAELHTATVNGTAAVVYASMYDLPKTEQDERTDEPEEPAPITRLRFAPPSNELVPLDAQVVITGRYWLHAKR